MLMLKKRQKLFLGLVLVVSLLVINGVLFFSNRINLESKNTRLDSSVSEALYNGKCDQAQIDQISEVAKNSSGLEQAGLYEQLGKCFTFINNYSSAYDSYMQAVAIYRSNEQEDIANSLQTTADAVKKLTEVELYSPAEDYSSEPVSY